MTSRRPIVLIVDVEPDGRAVLDRENGWKGSAQALEHLARLRGELETATREQVRFNWFIRADPQIALTWGRADFVADACPGVIRAIEANDDSCGVHTHLWRFDKQRSVWFSDFSDPEWIDECVSTSVAAFTRIFGRAPVLNRFGDRWMSEDGLAAIRRAGILFDLTVEPGLPAEPVHDDPYATGWPPDFRGAPRKPYVPLGNNYMRASPTPHEDDIWMLPLTTSPIAMRIIRRFPFVTRASRSPNLVLDQRTVWPIIKGSLDKPKREPLVIVLRSGDLTNRKFRRNFLNTTASLIRHPALPFCDFVSAEEAVARSRELT